MEPRTLIRGFGSEVADQFSAQRPHPANRRSSSACTPRNPATGHDSTLTSRAHRRQGNPSRRMRGVSQKARKVKGYASNSIAGSSDRGGCPPVAGESLYSDAGNHQVNFERRRGHCLGFVDPECYRAIPFSSQYPAWEGMTIRRANISRNLPPPMQETMQPGRILPPKETILKTRLLLTVGIALSVSAFAQTNRQTTLAVEAASPTYTFRVNVVSRSVPAVNYEHRSGASKLDFAGTDLMPSANGEAKVNSRRGSIEIDAQFGDLRVPTTFGNEYLTYVLWAISPEGRAVNLGEVLVGENHRSKLRVT